MKTPLFLKPGAVADPSVWHSTGPAVTDGHPQADCPGEGCPVIAVLAARDDVEWLWCSNPYATFGIGIVEDTVVDAAEFARFLLGCTEAEARAVILDVDPDTIIVPLEG